MEENKNDVFHIFRGLSVSLLNLHWNRITRSQVCIPSHTIMLLVIDVSKVNCPQSNDDILQKKGRKAEKPKIRKKQRKGKKRKEKSKKSRRVIEFC